MSVENPVVDRKIVIVEDSRVVFTELKHSIEALGGFSVDVVSTYDDAKEFLNWNANEIFLAILDLTLPGSPNGEVVDLFCSMAVPSIIFTSDFTQQTRDRMGRKGIIDYVVKDAHAVNNIVRYAERLRKNLDIKVLVVEDSESFRFALCSLLHKLMFQVLDAPDGETAITMLNAEDGISMVITDYEMPGINGVELTQVIRKRFKKEDMVIIGLSSSSDTMLTAKFIKMGANDFLGKPFEPETFHSRINNNIEVMETIQALKDANAVKNHFLGMAAHDLRSPISGINGFTEMLLQKAVGELSEEQFEMIEFIHTANKHMNSMVNDLLDISVIEAGKLQLIKSENNLEELVSKRLRLHGFAAKKKSIVLTPYMQGIPQFVFDERRIGQVVDNLLTNAIKFSPVAGHIEVHITEENGMAKFSVVDDGQGIPPGEESLVFRSFSVTSVRPTAGEVSTGLGLPIVKKIVEAHKGTVWVESVFGKGATFSFTLPMA